MHHPAAQRRFRLRRIPDHPDGLRRRLGAHADRTRDWIAAFNERDFDALFEVADDDIEWVVAREHPAATTHRGPEEVRAYMDDWLGTMPDLRLEVDELAEAGDHVLVIGRIRGAGAGSGAGAGVTLCTLSTFDGDRAIRVEEFLDPATARAEFEHRKAAPE